MTLVLIIAFKESEVSGEIVAVYVALRFYLCACVPLCAVAFSACDSFDFTSICFLLLYICLLPVMVVGIKHV